MRSQNFAEIDLENLVAELEGMGGSQKQALESNLEVLLMYLLKYKYQSDKSFNGWRYTIIEYRLRLHSDCYRLQKTDERLKAQCFSA